MKPHLLPLLAACSLWISGHAQEETAPLLPPEDQLSISADTTIAPPVSADGTRTLLDILVVYTPAARAYAGSATAMRAAILAYVATANRCYTNSDIAITLRLASTAEVAYTESATNMSADIGWAQTDATIATLRNTYGADLVCLVRRGAAGGAAGVGYLGSGQPNFAPWAVCVVADDWADANLTFPHEVGHNFGCNHDRGNAGNPTTGYSYGWRFNGNDAVLYRTVMSYAPGTRIPYFSNPSISYQGVATGVATGSSTSADNALAIETNAAVTAGFRQTVNGVRSDFNSDGYADILFRAADGRLCAWFMNATTRSASAVLGNTFSTPNWTPIASADFDGDGYTDMLFKSTDGRLCLWFMNGTMRTTSTILPYTFASASWIPIAAADFNGDGKADILFKSADGHLSVWFMNGTTRTTTAVLAYTYAFESWAPVAAADFNGDGKTGILFSSTTGRLCIWFMNGTTRITSTVLANSFSSPTWFPFAAADQNGDGKADILFKSTDLRICTWFMNGTTRAASTVYPFTYATGWAPF